MFETVEPDTVPLPAPTLDVGTVFEAVNAYAPPAIANEATIPTRNRSEATFFSIWKLPGVIGEAAAPERGRVARSSHHRPIRALRLPPQRELSRFAPIPRRRRIRPRRWRRAPPERRRGVRAARGTASRTRSRGRALRRTRPTSPRRRAPRRCPASASP